MPNKRGEILEKVILQKASFMFEKGDYDVSITDNGFQWSTIYTGKRPKAKLIYEAFKAIGYKAVRKMYDEKSA